MVGTGTTPVAVSDYKLETIIAHGVWAGNLSYGATSVSAFQVVAGEARIIVSRPFTNLSGALITVREAGVYVGTQDPANTTRFYLICRDLLSPAVDVPDTKTLSVDYKFGVTA